ALRVYLILVHCYLRQIQLLTFPTRRSSDLSLRRVLRLSAPPRDRSEGAIRSPRGGPPPGDRETPGRGSAPPTRPVRLRGRGSGGDRKSTRLNSSHVKISYADVCL